MEFRTLTKRISEQLGVEAPVIADAPTQAANSAGAPEMPAIADATYTMVSDLETLDVWIAKAYAKD